MSYSLAFTAKAQRQLRRLEGEAKRRIRAALITLARNPYAPGLDVKKLRGRTEEYRLRVGSYRVVDEVANATLTVTVIEVDHRRDIDRCCRCTAESASGLSAGVSGWGSVGV